MMMEMKSTWLYPPIMLHSSREFSCDGFETAEQCAWYQHRWHFWYEPPSLCNQRGRSSFVLVNSTKYRRYIADWVYALPTIAFFMCCLGIFILPYAAHQLFSFRRARPSALRRKTTAFLRYLSYRGFRIEALHWNSASVGLLLLALVGTIFFFCKYEVIRVSPTGW
jgi:hypothetical protein